MLKENTFFGENNKIDIAIKNINMFSPKEGYFEAFSGGKDSIVLDRLFKMSKVKHDAHFNLTTIDPPELIYFIRDNYPDVTVDRPEMSMWKLLVSKRGAMPPTRIVRYCCSVLKERGGIGRLVATGIRWAESSKRKERKMVETCYRRKSKGYVHPIIDWTDAEVWEFIKLFNMKYCKLYDEGYKRIGCIMCPMAGTKGMLRDAERFPKYYQRYLKSFEELLRVRKERGLKSENWNTAQDVMDWWIYGKKKEDENQVNIFK